MKAYMSGPNEYQTSNDYLRHVAAERAYPVLAHNASAVEAWRECKALMAEREARAILAASEPETRCSSTFAPVSYYPPWSSRSERGQMHTALAEALAGFTTEVR